MNEIPDSQILLSEFIAFQLRLASVYFSQYSYGLFDKAVNKAKTVYFTQAFSQLTEQQKSRLFIDMHLALANQALLTEQYDHARLLAEKIKQHALAEPALNSMERQVTLLKANYIFAIILNASNDPLNAREAYIALELQVTALINEFLDDADPTREADLRDLYEMVFLIQSKQLSYSNYARIEYDPLIERFTTLHNKAKDLFDKEHNHEWQYYLSILNKMNASNFEKRQQVQFAREAYDDSIDMLEQLILLEPHNLKFYSALVERLSDRLTFSLHRDPKQSEEDLKTLNQLSNFLAEQVEHPAQMCKFKLNAGFYSLKYESSKKKPNSNSIYKDALMLANYCNLEYQLPIVTTYYKLLYHYYQMQAVLKSDKLEEKLNDIEKLRENIFLAINELERLGATGIFSSEKKYWAFISSNAYLKLLPNDERIKQISDGLVVIESFTSDMIQQKAGNISWQLSSKANHYQTIGDYQQAFEYYQQTTALGLEYFAPRKKTLITNSIWALTQQINLASELGDLSLPAALEDQFTALVEKIDRLQLADKRDLTEAIQRYWSWTVKGIDAAIEKGLDNEFEVLVTLHDRAISLNQRLLETLSSPNENNEQAAKLTNTLYDLKSINIKHVVKEDGKFTAELPVGWVYNSVFSTTDSYTLSGDDPEVNQTLLSSQGDSVLQRAMYNRLPFYDHCRLIITEYLSSDGESFQRYYLEDAQANNLWNLNGTSPPIHEANKVCSINIKEKANAAAYLRFFCSFVHGDEGAFYLVETIDDMNWLKSASDVDKAKVRNLIRPIHLWKADNKSHWNATATVNYGNGIFYAKFEILDTGILQMINDFPLASDLKVNTFSLATNSGRTSNFIDRVSILKAEKYSTSFELDSLIKSILSKAKGDINKHFQLLQLVTSLYKDKVYDPYKFENYLALVSNLFEQSNIQNADLLETLRKELFTVMSKHLEEHHSTDLLTISFARLFASDFQIALEVAEKGLAINKENYPIAMNKAHALMFLGREEEAMNLYKEHIGKPVQGKTWNYYVEDDFDKLESVGLSHPMIPIVRKMFKSN